MDAPQRIPLVAKISTRNKSLLQDARLVNAIAEKDQNTGEYQVERRVGYASTAFLSTTGAGQGMYNWRGAQQPWGGVVSIFGGAFYVNASFISGGLDTSNGVYQFVQTRGNPGFIVFGNGVKAYYYNNSVVTQITDPNFPTSFCKGWAYLDGTLYVMDTQAQIFGTATGSLDSPVTWDPLNKIIARIEPDTGVCLAKQANYVIALKQWTTEVFYDNQNPTGSPLASYAEAKQPYGCLSADTVQSVDDVLIWATQDQTANIQVVRMDGLQIRIVSTKPVERLLQNFSVLDVFESAVLKVAGHVLYVLTAKSANITLVYDMTEDLWYVWTDANGNHWPVSAATALANTGLIQHESNGSIYNYNMDYVYPTDAGGMVPVDIYTPNVDFKVRGRRKQVPLLYLNADKVSGSQVDISWSDDDYNTFSAPRTVDLNLDRPMLDNLGTFTRRAFHIRHNKPLPFRITSAELELNLGTL